MLANNTDYWISMSGTTEQLIISGLNTSFPDDAKMPLFTGPSFELLNGTYFGDMAFRLHGHEATVAVVPELNSALIWSGIGLITLTVGKQRRWRSNALRSLRDWTRNIPQVPPGVGTCGT
jgi:hypothetical protein